MNKAVVPHDLSWKPRFSGESSAIQLALGLNVLAIHHIGSTSIPGILAKPIIDILVEVGDLAIVDQHAEEMCGLGYEVMGAFGIEGRRYFRKINTHGIRTHHVHVFERGSSDITRHIAFRDFLATHPEKAREYSELKAALTSDGNISWEDYLEGKKPFITATEIEALEWVKNRRKKVKSDSENDPA